MNLFAEARRSRSAEPHARVRGACSESEIRVGGAWCRSCRPGRGASAWLPPASTSSRDPENGRRSECRGRNHRSAAHRPPITSRRRKRLRMPSQTKPGQDPFPGHRPRGIAAICCRCGQRMMAARAADRADQQHRDQHRGVPPRRKQPAARGGQRRRCLAEFVGRGSQHAPSYNVSFLFLLKGTSSYGFIRRCGYRVGRAYAGRKVSGLAVGLHAPQLGAIAVREAVKRAGIDPNTVDECIMGNVVQAGLGQNPARQAALGGGLVRRPSRP